MGAKKTHAMTGSPEYESWKHMKHRCKNSNSHAYHRYGGRGITVCKRWNKFENFLADMGPRPEGRTLDRINNDGNYEPGNCRWATRKEQLMNRSTSLSVIHNGVLTPLKIAAEAVGIKYDTAHDRLTAGLSDAEILAPLQRASRRVGAAR